MSRPAVARRLADEQHERPKRNDSGPIQHIHTLHLSKNYAAIYALQWKSKLPGSFAVIEDNGSDIADSNAPDNIPHRHPLLRFILIARAANLSLSSSCTPLYSKSSHATRTARTACPTSVTGSEHVCIPPALRHYRLPRRIPALPGRADGRKQLLPTLGGSSAVWLTCLVFFQVTLLLGYLYAHWIRAAGLQLAAACLSRHARRSSRSVGRAEDLSRQYWAKAPTILSRPSSSRSRYTIGLPFLLLGATSPLLQMWFLRTEGGSIPYRLFALSNAGSLLALIAYPFVVEPNLTLKLQRTLWSFGFLVYAVLCTSARPADSPDPQTTTQRTTSQEEQPCHQHKPLRNGFGFCFPWPPPCS